MGSVADGVGVTGMMADREHGFGDDRVVGVPLHAEDRQITFISAHNGGV